MIELSNSLWASVPVWGQYLLQGICLCAVLVFGAIVAGRTGRSPYWALLLIVPLPFLSVILVWAFAHTRWPRMDGAKPAADDTPA